MKLLVELIAERCYEHLVTSPERQDLLLHISKQVKWLLRTYVPVNGAAVDFLTSNDTNVDVYFHVEGLRILVRAKPTFLGVKVDLLFPDGRPQQGQEEAIRAAAHVRYALLTKVSEVMPTEFV